MKRKGQLLVWDLEKIETTKAELQDMGFDKYLPRNNNSETFTKAVNEYTKSVGHRRERFHEDSDVVRVGIFSRRIEGDDLSLDKELIVTFDKKSGVMLSTDNSHPAFEELKALYRKHSGTINTDQLRSMILRIIKNEAYGIGIRRHGGVYFVDDRHKGSLENVEKIFKAFPGNARLDRYIINDDAESMQSLEHQVSDAIGDEIQGMIEQLNKEFAEGSITKRKLESRKEMAEELLDKMKAHEDNLRGSYMKVHQKLGQVRKALEDVTTKVESGLADTVNFLDLLKEI